MASVCRYFDEPGDNNAAKTVKIALARAVELGLKKLIVSYGVSGATFTALESLLNDELEVIVVGRQPGTVTLGDEPIPQDVRERIRKACGTVLIATEPLSSVRHMPGCEGADSAYRTLEMFCPGVRTCVEMAMMCADAGLVNTTICRDGEIVREDGEEVVCITEDTACVIRSADTGSAWKDVQWKGGLRVREILCMPAGARGGGNVDCRYFDKLGKMNTGETIDIAISQVKKLGIRKIAVASISGWSALKVLEAASGIGIEVIVMGRQYGLAKPNPKKIISEETKEKIKTRGGHLLFSTIAVGGVARMPGCTGALVARDTLMMFSPGMKVCVEIAIMCADAGLVDVDERMLCLAGTKAGLDTAAVIKPATSNIAWDTERGLRVLELLCKPR